MSEVLQRLLRALAASIEGQEDACTGLVLALAAGEHAYLEGPPGCAKSRLAEALARAAGARSLALRFHRDAGPAEWFGDAILVRERRGDAERLRIAGEAGGLADAEVILLDDLARAPGEALVPVLRLLAERRLGPLPVPLETAIATSLPPELESYSDPLEPTALDRFAIQVRMRGHLLAREWASARRLLERDAWDFPSPVLDAAARRALRLQVRALPIEQATRAAYLRLVPRLAELAGPDAAARITDRAFGRAALALVRAHALLRGAASAQPRDLAALRYMLARRAPTLGVGAFDALLADALAPSALAPGVPAQSAHAPGAHAPLPPPAAHASGLHAGEGGGAPRAAAAASELAHDVGLTPVVRSARREARAAQVAPLVRALEGLLERSRARAAEDPGGQPRRLRRLRRLDEIGDADVVEAALFAHGEWPETPRSWRRERRLRGGRLAVLRDVSASMEGRLARWAGEVVTGLVHSARRHRMRIGYVEFNHAAERYQADGAFFHRRYARVLELAATRRAEGRTNYEAPLACALEAFRGGPHRQRHVALLTDGVPVVGDPSVRRAREQARRLGVRVHTVFLGLGACPPLLDLISHETEGLRFATRPSAGGGLRLVRREETR